MTETKTAEIKGAQSDTAQTNAEDTDVVYKSNTTLLMPKTALVPSGPTAGAGSPGSAPPFQVHVHRTLLDRLARVSSDSLGNAVGFGELSLMESRPSGDRELGHASEALLINGGATVLIKRLTNQGRPNGEPGGGFPSGHTSTAFTMASALSRYKPQSAPLAYALASLIGWSRVKVRAHYWNQILAGAALGYYTGRRYTRP